MYRLLLLFLITFSYGQQLFTYTPFQGANKRTVHNATIYIVGQTSGDSLLLTEYTGAKSGTYYRDNVPNDVYKIYIQTLGGSQTLVNTGMPFGATTGQSIADSISTFEQNLYYGNLVNQYSAAKDSSANIDAAFTSAIAGNKQLFFPNGVYRVGSTFSTLQPSGNVISIEGESRQGTKIYYNDNAGYMLTSLSDSVYIKDITIISNTASGLFYFKNSNVVLDNVYILMEDTNETNAVAFDGCNALITNSTILNIGHDNDGTNAGVNHQNAFAYGKGVTSIYNSVIKGFHYGFSTLSNSADVYMYNTRVEQTGNLGDVLNVYAGNNYTVVGCELIGNRDVINVNTAANLRTTLRVYDSYIESDFGNCWRTEGTVYPVDSSYFYDCAFVVDTVNSSISNGMFQPNESYLEINNCTIEAKRTPAYPSLVGAFYTYGTDGGGTLKLTNVAIHNVGFGYLNGGNVKLEATNVHTLIDSAASDSIAQLAYIQRTAPGSYFKNSSFISHQVVTGGYLYGLFHHLDSDAKDLDFSYCTFQADYKNLFAWELATDSTVFNHCTFSSYGGIGLDNGDSPQLFFNNCVLDFDYAVSFGAGNIRMLNSTLKDTTFITTTFSGGSPALGSNFYSKLMRASNRPATDFNYRVSGSSAYLFTGANSAGNDGFYQTGVSLTNSTSTRFQFNIFNNSGTGRSFKVLFTKSGQSAQYVNSAKTGLTTSNSSFDVAHKEWANIDFTEAWPGVTGGDWVCWVRVSGADVTYFIDEFSIDDGSERLTNGDFEAWTGDNPDNWIQVDDGSDNITFEYDPAND